MRALIQRVSKAEVRVAGDQIAGIGPGLLVLICALTEDDDTTAVRLAAKVARMRIFADSDGKMNLSVLDTAGSALVVSQFTLAADTKRGNRPGFSRAAAPAAGEALYETFLRALEQQGVAIATGRFGADMQVSLTNDGPVTIWIDTTETA